MALLAKGPRRLTQGTGGEDISAVFQPTKSADSLDGKALLLHSR
jgi:hypothetical protein